MHGVHYDRCAREAGSDAAEDTRLRAVGVDDVVAPAADEAREAQERDEVLPGMDAPAEGGLEMEPDAVQPAIFVQRAFRAGLVSDSAHPWRI